jgi:1-acyl-sn-glycerol-3-phosphate acyltransferase
MSWYSGSQLTSTSLPSTCAASPIARTEHLEHPQSSVTSTPSRTSVHSEHAAPLSTDHRQIADVNHSSYLDGLVMLAALPHPMSMVAKRELAGRFFAGRFLRGIGTRFVERFDARRSLDDETALVQCAAASERLLFFPEGTFVRAAGLRAFHLGAFVAACTARCAVVPIAIAGTRAILRDGIWLPPRGAITVTVMPALDPTGTDLHSAAALRDAVRNAIAPATGEPCVDAVAPLEPPHIAAP